MKPAASILALALVLAPAAAEGGELLILHFRTEAAFASITRAPHVVRANGEFNAWVQTLNDDIARDQRDLHHLRRARMDARPEDAPALDAELIEKEKAFEEKFARHGAEIAARRRAVRDALEDQLLFLVRELAEERGAALVFEKRASILLYDTTHDITEEIARRYAERFDSLESPYTSGKAPRPLEETPLSLPGFELYRPPLAVRLPPLPAPAKETAPPHIEAAESATESPLLSDGLLQLGRRELLQRGDAVKALRVWREMAERAGAPLWGVTAGTGCDTVALQALVGAREGAFALPLPPSEGAEGCARVYLAVFRDERDAARAAEDLGGESRNIR